jgi:DNA-binding transcriptional ArsR family regulator
VSAESTSWSLLIGPSSSRLRRSLTPTAWVVLEELVLRSTTAGEHRGARASVRSLAASLGLTKDTVASAIRRLRSAGVVSAAQQRTIAGVFDTGVYVITIPADVIAVKRIAVVKPRHSVGASSEAQLPLALES